MIYQYAFEIFHTETMSFRIHGITIDPPTWVGVVFHIRDEITGNERDMNYLIEEYNGCCEEFGVEFEELTTYIGWHFISAKSYQPFTDKIISSENYGQQEIVKLILRNPINDEEKEVFIRIYNIHNGYYPHKVKFSYYRDDTDAFVEFDDEM